MESTINLADCYLINARSIGSKLTDLDCFLSTNKPSILCLTETWLDSGTPDNVLVSQNEYSVFRKDRSVGKGGGVSILVRSDIFTAVSVEVPDRFSHLEIVATDIVNTACKLRIFTCYRPPSGDADSAAMQYMKDMCDCLDALYPVNSTVVINYLLR